MRAAFAPQRSADVAGYEIWFAVISDPVARVALWLRYTRYVPEPATGRGPQAILWASFFDADHPENHCFQARSFPLSEARFAEDHIDLPGARLEPGALRGSLVTPRGTLAWDVTLTHRFAPESHGPAFLTRSNLASVRSVVVAPFAAAAGTITLAPHGRKKGGRAATWRFKNARAVFTHISGSRRVPELYWCYVPFLHDGSSSARPRARTAALEHGGADAAIEAVFVRPAALAPGLCFGSLLWRGEVLHDAALTRGLLGGARVSYPEQRYRLRFGSLRAELSGRMNLEQKTGYIYRDPDEKPFFIVQSDVSAAECRLVEGDGTAHTLHADGLAAVEFHGARPWPGVMYLDPYA